MGMALADLPPARPGVDISVADLAEHLRLIEVSPDLHRGVDQTALHVVVAPLAGENVATPNSPITGTRCH
jgi:hypothetical protein